MGSIVHTPTQPQRHPHTNPSSQSPIALSDYQTMKVTQNGHLIIREKEMGEGLFVSMRIPEVVYCCQKQRISQWVNSVSKNSCNVLKHMLENQSFFCSSHVNFKAVLEYSSCDLASILKNTPGRYPLEETHLNKNQFLFRSAFDILNFIKFLIQAAEEHHQNTRGWPIFHTSNLLYFLQNRHFKYFYMPTLEESQQHQIFFDPEFAQHLNAQSQYTSVFSIGMTVISLILKEDCSDCYDYQHFQFCQSAFQQKLEKLESLSSKQQVLCQLSYSNYGDGPTLQDQLIDFALAITSPLPKRPSFSALRRKYFKLLRQISVGCESASCASTKRRGDKQSKLLQIKRPRLDVIAFDTRQSLFKRRENSQTQDTFEFVEQTGRNQGKGNPKNKRKRQKAITMHQENKENMGRLQYR